MRLQFISLSTLEVPDDEDVSTLQAEALEESRLWLVAEPEAQHIIMSAKNLDTGEVLAYAEVKR